MKLCLPILGAIILAGCASVPPVNTDTISTKPASAALFANATKAVDACSMLPNAKKMFGAFEALGVREKTSLDATRIQSLPAGGTRVTSPTAWFDDGNLVVQASEKQCLVGLRSMTSDQSFELGQRLASHYGAMTNAEFGNGLSDHVVQAWRLQQGGVPSTLIAAHKTWPWDIGQRPQEPGAAVTLKVN